jgi:hypothetical protein
MNRVETARAKLDLRLVEILRHHEIAVSILSEYPDGLERFKLAVNEGHGPTKPKAADTPTTRQEVNVCETRVRS